VRTIAQLRRCEKITLKGAGKSSMTTNQIVIAAVVAGTCWTWILQMTINHAANRIIKRIDELENKKK
jgi:hypothetical protein